MKMLIPLAVAGLGFLLVDASCSIMIDSNRQQCSTDTDCTLRGGAFAGSTCINSVCQPDAPATAWSCLGSVTLPAPAAGNVTATLNLKDIITMQPVVGVSANVCLKLDVGCTEPIATALQSDVAGKLVIYVPSGFDGYVQLLPPNAIPGSYFFYPPVTETREVPFVPILPLSELTSFAQLVNTQLLPGRGHVVLGAYDCSHAPAEGVSLSSPDADVSAVPFYMIKGRPSTSAGATDSQGYGGILDLRAGSVLLSGKLASGATIGVESLLIRAGEISYTSLLPLP